MICHKTIFRYVIGLILINTSLFAQTIYVKNNFRIHQKDIGLSIFFSGKQIAEIESFAFNFIESRSMKVINTTDNSISLKLAFDETDGYNRDFPKEIELKITQIQNGLHFSATHNTFRHITIRLKDLDEHYFGLIEKLYPNNSKNPDLRSNTVDVEVYANGNRDYAENYASAYSAFYMSSNGYGSFFDTFAKGRYKFAINGKTEIYHQTGVLDWYLFYGPTGEKIHKQYYDIIGKPKYIPIWACGPIFWRDQNDGGKDEILEDIQKFTNLNIPLTACFLDRPYSDGGHQWSKMNFNDTFAEPEKWIKAINEKYGLQFMTWVAPMTFGDPDFPGLLRNYKSYMDLTNPETLKEFEKRMSGQQYNVGVRGHKMDRADENFPVTAKWNEPISESESRNKYVYLYSKVIHDFLTKAHGKNQFNFARAAFHRSQPFLSAVWGGDSRSNWHGMSGNQANAIRAGFMGFPVFGNDTGGYLGEGRIDEKMYIRWLQWSAFNGMFEVKIDGSGGSGKDRPPWKYSEQLQDVYRNVSELRMNLLPTIYSAANTSYKNGVIMKPLAYAYPADKNTYAIWDEYIFGNALLIAPFFTADDQRTIYLPQGKWCNFNDVEEIFEGPVTIDQKHGTKSIPVFIKENSIYLTGQIYQGNSRQWHDIRGNETITVNLFPGQQGTQTRFDYIDYLNKDLEVVMIMENKQDVIFFKSPPLSTNSTIKARLEKEPSKVTLNGNPVSYEFEKNTGIATTSIEAKQEIRIEIIL